MVHEFYVGQVVTVRADSPSSMKGCTGHVVQVGPGCATNLRIMIRIENEPGIWVMRPIELDSNQEGAAP